MKIAFDPQMSIPRALSENDGNSNAKNDALKQVCMDFEALFVNQLFQQMRKSIPKDGYLEHDMSMDLFEEIMDMEVAREMARKGGFGIGERLYEDFQKKADSYKEKD